jgi:hypothetical protein
LVGGTIGETVFTWDKYFKNLLKNHWTKEAEPYMKAFLYSTKLWPLRGQVGQKGMKYIFIGKKVYKCIWANVTQVSDVALVFGVFFHLHFIYKLDRYCISIYIFAQTLK